MHLTRTLKPRTLRPALATLLLLVPCAWMVASGQEEEEDPPPAPFEFEHRTGSANPLGADGATPVFAAEGTMPYLAAGDLDGDGDLDLVIGERTAGASPTGTISYYRNVGSPASASFQKLTGSHELSGVQSTIASKAPAHAFPALVDADSDGDLDLLVGGVAAAQGGEDSQNVLLFRNEGSATNPAFVYVTEPNNPFAELLAEPGSPGSPAPAFADMTGDGAPEVFTVGPASDSLVYYYVNGGTPDTPFFSAPRTTAAEGNPVPFDGDRHYPGGETRISAGDVDFDGDADLVVGFEPDSGDLTRLRFVENTGSPASVSFAEEASPNRFGETDAGLSGLATPHPTFLDLDGDGDLDLLVGVTDVNGSGDPVSRIRYFENVGALEVAVRSYVGAISNRPGDGARVAANKVAGTLYLVLDGEPQATREELELAVQANRGSRAPIPATRSWTLVSTEDLPSGTYRAYGVAPDGTRSAAASRAVVVNSPDAFGTDSSNAWIESVTIGGTTSTSGNNQGYARFDEQTIEVTPGASYHVRIVPGFSPDHPSYVRRLAWQHYGMWLDFNNDGDFSDPGETLLTTGPHGGELETQVTIPSGTPPADPVRLRIIMQFHEAGDPTVDGAVAYGEVEEYSVTIQ